MKINDFKPTAYRYETTDGNSVLGEYFLEGIKYYLIQEKDRKVAIKSPNVKLVCLDLDMSDREPRKDTRISDLEARVKALEDQIRVKDKTSN